MKVITTKPTTKMDIARTKKVSTWEVTIEFDGQFSDLLGRDTWDTEAEILELCEYHAGRGVRNIKKEYNEFHHNLMLDVDDGGRCEWCD